LEWPRARITGPREPTEVSDDAVALRYVGQDGVARSTTLRFEPPPDILALTSAIHNLVLEPGAETVVHVLIEARQDLKDQAPLPAQDLLDN
jgi:hypothetical protein